MGRWVIALLCAVVLVGCTSPDSEVPFVIDDERVSDQVIADAAVTWLVAVGWTPEDPADIEVDATLWRSRLEETCDQDPFALEGFVELAARYATEDLPTYGAPRSQVVNVAKATDGLWIMASSFCGHLFLDDEDPSGLPFDDLTDNGQRVIRGDTTWETQSTPRVLDAAGVVESVEWRDYSVPLSPPPPLELRHQDGEVVMWMYSSTCPPVVTVQSLQADGGVELAVAVYDYLFDGLGETSCGAVERAWELAIALNEPLDGPDLAVVDERTAVLAGASTPAPQAADGSGWRLLASEYGVGTAYETSLLASEAELRMFWSDFGLSGEVPGVDWEEEIVLHFAPASSSECRDHRLRSVAVDEQVVFPEIDLVVHGDGCTDDANPFTFLVAFERDRLPDPPFAIELRSEACVRFGNEQSCEQERTPVTAADLEWIAPLDLDDEVVEQAMKLWWNQTGLLRDDPVVWVERLSEMCDEGVWDREVALALAEEYEAQDMPVSARSGGAVGPSVSDMASALTTMALTACRESFPPDALPGVPDAVVNGMAGQPQCDDGSASESYLLDEDSPGASTPERAVYGPALRARLNGEPTLGMRLDNGDHRFWWLDGDRIIAVAYVTETPAGGWALVELSWCT